LHDATIAALSSVIEPLVELMFETGVTIREFNNLSRERAVKIASLRQSRDRVPQSKAKISILTGIPRSEVTRILNDKQLRPSSSSGQHPIRRVLTGWFEDPLFLSQDGDPLVLPIFGKRRSFERLVNKYSSGIPTRAMLDELIRVGAVSIEGKQIVKVKERIPQLFGLSADSINVLGYRGRDLLYTLTKNALSKASRQFEATAVVEDADMELVSVARREISMQGATFISGIDELLRRVRAKTTRGSRALSKRHQRIGVTVFYFQDEIADRQLEAIPVRRKNLRRNVELRPKKPPPLKSPKEAVPRGKA